MIADLHTELSKGTHPKAGIVFGIHKLNRIGGAPHHIQLSNCIDIEYLGGKRRFSAEWKIDKPTQNGEVFRRQRICAGSKNIAYLSMLDKKGDLSFTNNQLCAPGKFFTRMFIHQPVPGGQSIKFYSVDERHIIHILYHLIIQSYDSKKHTFCQENGKNITFFFSRLLCCTHGNRQQMKKAPSSRGAFFHYFFFFR